MTTEFERDVTLLPLAEKDISNEVGRIESNDLATLLKKGITAAQNGERDLARTLLISATDVDSRSEDAWMWLASISEFPEELLEFLNNVLDINPENERAIEWRKATYSLLAKTLVQRGIAAHEDGTDELAAHSFDQALGYDEDCESAWFWKASVTESKDDAAKYLERVLTINPENKEACDALKSMLAAKSRESICEATAAALAGNYGEARDTLEQVVRNAPENFVALILKSHLSLNFDEKIEIFEKILAIDPENQTARSGFDFLTALIAETKPEVSESTETASESEVKGFDESDMVADASAPTGELELPADVEPENQGEHLEAAESDETGFEAEGQSESDMVNFAEVETSAPKLAEPQHIDPPMADEVGAADVTPLETVEPGVESVFLDGGRKADELFGPFVEYADAGRETVEINASKMPALSETYVGNGDKRTNFVVADGSHGGETFDAGTHESEADGDLLEIHDLYPLEMSEATHPLVEFSCPYCSAENESQAFECTSCHATMTLADIEALLSNSRADRDIIRQTVTRMEAIWNSREFDEHEFVILGIGHFNLGNYEFGLKYLQEASRLDPNDVILAGQLNAIAIRLDEMRRQDEVRETSPKGMSILVIDDSATVRKLISGKLQKAGHNVVCAVDGIEGLSRVQEGLPDLILLDIAMPRMDGYQVCKQIRSNPGAKDIPIVMISGKDGFFDKVRGRMAGCTGYITKPFGPETLMKALETYLIWEPANAA